MKKGIYKAYKEFCRHAEAAEQALSVLEADEGMARLPREMERLRARFQALREVLEHHERVRTEVLEVFSALGVQVNHWTVAEVGAAVKALCGSYKL